MSINRDYWEKEDRDSFLITQNGWIPKYNDAGKIMASLPDYYHAGFEGDGELLSSLHADFGTSVLTSTRIIYRGDSLMGNIIHYYGSNVVESIDREVLIPDYSSDALLNDVLATEEGLNFMKAILLTEDSIDGIVETLQRLGKKDAESIRIGTLFQNDRSSNPERAVSLSYNGGRFHIDGNYNMDNDGRSRPVAASR